MTRLKQRDLQRVSLWLCSEHHRADIWSSSRLSYRQGEETWSLREGEESGHLAANMSAALTAWVSGSANPADGGFCFWRPGTQTA